jgi:hypothetical protein
MRQAGLAELQAFNPNQHVGKKVKYTSPSDNNLDAKHQPDHVALQIKWLNKTPHPGFADGYGINAWEVWNEPQFPQNGAWDAQDMARYAVDCAHAIHAVDPTVQVGVPLHEDDMQWNWQLLHDIAAIDPAAISFMVFHPYDFAWIKTQHQTGSYYARVGAAEELRNLRIREKVQLVMRMGHGRWRVTCSEWNIHPPGYDKPYNVSTDMAVGIHIAGMFGVFWDEGVSSAHFFELFGRKPESHFNLAVRTNEGPKLTPAGEVFRLYTQNFTGDRLNVKCQTSSMTYPWKDGRSFEVPMVIAHSAFDSEKKLITLILTNRHKTASAQTSISLSNFQPAGKPQLTTLTTKTAESMDILTLHPTLDLAAGPDPKFNLDLPPHSVTAVIIPGVIPPSQNELFANRMRFIKDWQIGQIIPPSDDSASTRMSRQLPDEAQSTKQSLSASSSGYVNVADLMAVTGQLGLLRDGFETVAQTSVFSPVDRMVPVSLGMDYWGILSINDQPVLNVTNRSGPPQPDTHRGDLPLKAGWNRLALRLCSGAKGMGFWVGVGDPGDLNYTDKPMTDLPKTFTIDAAQGTYVHGWDKARTVNIAHENVLRLSDAKPFRRRVYLRWNLSGLAALLKNHQARFRVELTQAYARGDGKAWLAPVTSTWDMNTLSFDNQPTLGKPISDPVDVHDAQWTFAGPDVDQLITQWLANPSDEYGIIVDTNITQYAGIANLTDPAKAPRLVVTLTD